MFKYTSVLILFAFLYIVGISAHFDQKTFNHSMSFKSRGRIIDGDQAGRKQFPYIGGLTINTSSGSMWCGASLISRNYLLTAAHCMQDANDLNVRLGGWNISLPDEEGRQEIYVPHENIIIHKYYNPATYRNDVALIKLPTPAILNEYVKIVKLPNRKLSSRRFVGREAFAIGWGDVSDSDKSGSEYLRFAKINIVNNRYCRAFDRRVRPTNICISTVKDRSTCYGDSGGPIVLANRRQTLIGITSFGSHEKCAAKHPDIYTRVTSYLRWIAKNSDVKIE